MVYAAARMPRNTGEMIKIVHLDRLDNKEQEEMKSAAEEAKLDEQGRCKEEDSRVTFKV